jgi:hypothetical protein
MLKYTYVVIARWPDDFHILAVYDTLVEAQRIKLRLLNSLIRCQNRGRMLTTIEIYARTLNVPVPSDYFSPIA